VRKGLSAGLVVLAAATAVVVALLASRGSPAQAQPVASVALPAPGAAKQLYPGCNNVSLTFPDGTTSQAVVQAVTPAGAVESMWRHNAAQNRFEGFSPQYPHVSDLLTVNFLDAVWFCMVAGPVQPPPPPPPPPPPGATATPTPTATATPTATPTSPPPPPGGGSWGAIPVDLAVTDIFIAPDTKVWARITNNGPNNFLNVSLTLECVMERHIVPTGVVDATQNLPMTITVNLNVGQTQEFDTGFQSFDTTAPPPQWWYKVTCTLQITYNDTVPANNVYFEYFPPPP
jgi:hypothetical protein